MQHLSNIELDQEFAIVVKTERKITHEVLIFIQEINRRSLHLSLGYDSLRSYLIQRHRYSEGAAGRRISAMQILTSVPEIKEKIIEGSLNLTQLAVAQSAIYQTQKRDHRKISNEEKANLLTSLENKTGDETKAEIANTLQIEIQEKKPITYGKGDTAYLNIKLTKQELGLIQETLSLMSHQAKDPKELLLLLCKKVVRIKKQPTQSAASAKESRANIAQVRSRHITSQTRRFVFTRDHFMRQFRGEDGRVCGSTKLLQPHHILAFAKGGLNLPDNLSLRCRTHNLFEAEKDGFQKMRT